MRKLTSIFTVLLILLFASSVYAGPLIFNNFASPGPISTDTISEYTSGAGVTIDSVLLKDGGGTFTGDTNIGSTTAGKNLSVNATLGAELAPALTGATTVNWTFAGTYTTPLAGTIEKAGAGTDTITPTAATTIVAGTTYKVVITFSAFTVTGASYTLGGVTGSALVAGTLSYTDYITAGTTGKFILTPIDAARFVISSISIKALTNATGDLTVDGNLVVRSQILPTLSESAYPSYSFASDTNTGMYNISAGTMGFVSDGALIQAISGSGFRLLTTSTIGWAITPGSSSVLLALYYDAANALAQRNSTTQQISRLYNTYTDASNYERLTLTGVQGASVNITAETAGTGGDNLDIVLTPAGTGGVIFTPKTITQASTDTLTAAECWSTVISNYGQAAENTQTLPAAAAGYKGRVSISTTGAGAFHLKAGASDKIYLNGTALDDGDKVTLAAPAVGDYFDFWTIQTGASAYDWVVVSGVGILIDGGV